MMGAKFQSFLEKNGITHHDYGEAEKRKSGIIERFNRTYRHEVLDAYVFKSIEQVQHITEDWLRVYNEQRPHDALGGLPPKQFLPRLTTAADSSNRLST